MSASLRCFVSAVLSLLLLVALAAPLSSPWLDAGAPVVAASGVHVDGVGARGDVNSIREALQSDRSSLPASYIKPQLAETVVAERGFDEAEDVLSPSPRTPRISPSGQTATDTPTQEPDTRRALLRVYRL